MNRLSRYLVGDVAFEIMGGQGELFLNDCAARGLPVREIRATATGFSARVPLRYYLRLHRLARKRRCRLRTTQKRGIWFGVRQYRRRLGIVVGVVAACLLMNVFSRTVWTVQFYDFTPQEQVRLRAELYALNICEGSMPSEWDLRRARETLFIEDGGYSTLSLNFVKGKLVAEKLDTTAQHLWQDGDGANLVALCDGLVERFELEGGYAAVAVGQSVAQGEILVSSTRVGMSEKLLSDAAKGKVYASVRRVYETTQPLAYSTRLPTGQTQSSYAVWAFGRLFSLDWLAPAPPAEASVNTLRYPLTVFGLPLPATVIETQRRGTREEAVTLTPQLAAQVARARLYDAMAAELPECKVRACEETVEQREDGVYVRMEIEARVNIATPAAGWD